VPADVRTRPEPFVANVLHDLQGPVGVIRALTELLLKGAFGSIGDDQRGALRDMEASAAFLADFTRNAVDLARASARSLTLDARPFDLTTTVRSVVRSMSTFAAARSVTIEVDAPATCSVHLDQARLAQILHNYVFNAIKFTPVGGSATARLSATADDVLIEVIDSGIGMAPGESDRLYSAFTRLDSGRAFEPSGAGLGLAVTRALVEAHGGSVGARSEDKGGSVFWARLPRHAIPTADPEPLERILHDLRGAIDVIDMYANLALAATEPLSPEHGDLVEVVNAAHRASELTARASATVEV